MKILMINSNQHKQMIPVIPFGMCWVCSSLEKDGHEVSVLDLMFSDDPAGDIEKRIADFNPALIGISIRNIDDGNLNFFLGEIKENIIDPCKQFFNGSIIIGGSAVGIAGREMLQFFNLNYAVRGDGELAMVRIASLTEQGKPLKDIKGLLIRNNNVFEENELNFENNFSLLPDPHVYKYIDIKQYAACNSHVQIQSKRGCALKCSYCVYSRIEGTEYRLREPGDIADEIEYLHKEGGIKTFEFTDSTFNIPLDHAKATLRAVIGKNIDVELKTSDFNPGGIDDEFAGLLKMSNFRELGITVESGSDVILKNMCKNYRTADVRRAVEVIRENIPSPSLSWSFLLGAPMESEETLNETYSFIQEITEKNETVIVATGIRVYKGTPIALELEKTGKNISGDNFFKPFLLEPEKISLSRIQSIAGKWTEENPNILLMEDLLDKEKMELFHFRMNLQSMFA